MITYNRLDYTRLSLPRLLETCDDRMRVWIWHNGNDEPTLEFVRSIASDPRVHKFHHSPQNKRLREPTNWFWSQSDAEYVSKIDDDNLMPDLWGQTLRSAHEAEPKLGVVACWSFLPEDVVPELVERKLRQLGPSGSGHKVMLNAWLAGTGHVMKRACYLQRGPMRDKQSFSNYCVHLAARGWINGWYYPFLYMENMDDPRSPYTRLKTEQDFAANRSLSAARFGIDSLEAFRKRQRTLALEVQAAHPDARRYCGWRYKLSRVREMIESRIPGMGRPLPKWS
jgi:hypothetical protein